MITEKKGVLLLLIAYSTLFICFAFFSQGTFESGDSIQHYLIARFSFKHPELFLHHWGKPFFTLLASPFAQIGFGAVAAFNTFCIAGAAYLLYLIASQLQMSRAWAAPVIVIFTPIYTVLTGSSLTEPLFSFLLVLTVFLFSKQKYFIGVLVVSFLPFVRTEGFFLLPVIGIYLLLLKQYRVVPVLAFGTLIYSLTGYFYYHDILWIIHENPYKGAKEIYGSGSLTHFLNKNEFILGTPIVLLFLIGMFFPSLVKVLSLAPLRGRGEQSLIYKLLFICFVVYVVLHSFFWWKGLFGSLGLIRVIAAITPCVVLVALSGFNLLLDQIKNKKLQNVFMALFVLWIVVMPFKQHKFPRPLGYEDKAVHEACNWVKHEYLTSQHYCYSFPYITYFLDIDPFNRVHVTEMWDITNETNAQQLPKGTLVFWDNHFSPAEGKTPLTVFLNDTSNFKFLNKFKGDKSEWPKEKEEFEIVLFRRK